jgi:hypothetical protein
LSLALDPQAPILCIDKNSIFPYHFKKRGIKSDGPASISAQLSIRRTYLAELAASGISRGAGQNLPGHQMPSAMIYLRNNPQKGETR